MVVKLCIIVTQYVLLVTQPLNINLNYTALHYHEKNNNNNNNNNNTKKIYIYKCEKNEKTNTHYTMHYIILQTKT